MGSQGHNTENCSVASGSDQPEYEESSNDYTKHRCCTTLPLTSSTSTDNDAEANPGECEAESLPGLSDCSHQGNLRNCASCPKLCNGHNLQAKVCADNEVQSGYASISQASTTDEIKRCVLLGLGLKLGLIRLGLGPR